jgi:hypothetical protein
MLKRKRNQIIIYIINNGLNLRKEKIMYSDIYR